MLANGFEAACVSWPALVRWNTQLHWSPAFGMGMTEFMGGGFPIIPRFNFADRDDARILLAAVLRQPLVLMGHHGDLSEGLEILAETARKMRGVGKLRWGSMEEIARGCFLTKRDGSSFWIRMQTRQIEVQIPEGIHQVFVDRPWLSTSAVEPLVIQATGGVCRTEFGGRVAGPILTASPTSVVFSCPPTGAANSLLPGASHRPWPPLWAMVRRLMCETRDRLKM